MNEKILNLENEMKIRVSQHQLLSRLFTSRCLSTGLYLTGFKGRTNINFRPLRSWKAEKSPPSPFFVFNNCSALAFADAFVDFGQLLPHHERNRADNSLVWCF